MQIHLVTLLILVPVTQAKEDRRPVPAPQPARQVLNVRINVGVVGQRGDAGFRNISVALPAPPPLADEEGKEQPAPIPMRLNINTLVVERENFDRWLFADERTDAERWRQLDYMLQAKIAAAAREHKLADRQRAKLRLAGTGDIKRFFDQVAERREDFEVQRQSFKTGRVALANLDSLSLIYRIGAFDDGSLFAKTLHRIVDEQKAGR